MCECEFESLRQVWLCVFYVVLSSPTLSGQAAWLNRTRDTASVFKLEYRWFPDSELAEGVLLWMRRKSCFGSSLSNCQ